MSTEHRGIVGELKGDSARRTLGDLGGHTPGERPDGWGMDGLSWAEAAAPVACVGGRLMRPGAPLPAGWTHTSTNSAVSIPAVTTSTRTGIASAGICLDSAITWGFDE
jgi:hypothetical protein